MQKKFLALTGLALLFPLSQCFNRSAERPEAQPLAPATAITVVDAPKADTVPAVPFSTLTNHWLDQNGVPTADARILLVYLQNASAQGLNPADYKTDAIAQLVATPGDSAAFEAALTRAFVAYTTDMTGPRVSPSLIGSQAQFWRKPLTKAEAFAQVDSAGGINQMLKGLEPQDPLYGALKTELATLTADTTGAGAAKIPQVVANMERLRWDLARPTRYIEANLAANTLRAVDGDKEIDINIINGRVDRQTAEFTAPITGIRFNPTWHVPVHLLLADKVPKLRKNPHCFDDAGFNFFYDGRKVGSGSINWNGMSNAEIAKHVSVTQSPGPKNALGHLFSLMQDPYTQYLHYTNQPELFAKDPRFISSGCMRMEDPDTIAAFIMQTTKEDIASHKGGRGDWDVKAPAPVTFFSVYRSITLDANGALVYHKDAYGRDKKIYDALKAKGHVPPAANKTQVAQNKPHTPKA